MRVLPRLVVGSLAAAVLFAAANPAVAATQTPPYQRAFPDTAETRDILGTGTTEATATVSPGAGTMVLHTLASDRAPVGVIQEATRTGIGATFAGAAGHFTHEFNVPAGTHTFSVVIDQITGDFVATQDPPFIAFFRSSSSRLDVFAFGTFFPGCVVGQECMGGETIQVQVPLAEKGSFTGGAQPPPTFSFTRTFMGAGAGKITVETGLIATSNAYGSAFTRLDATGRVASISVT